LTEYHTPPTTEPPPIKRLTPLVEQEYSALVLSLRYQLAGDATTFRPAPCGDGHRSRKGLHCSHCIDAEMKRRGVDVARDKHAYGMHCYAMFVREMDGTLRNVEHDGVLPGMVRPPTVDKPRTRQNRLVRR
jgi:hypothetical protein